MTDTSTGGVLVWDEPDSHGGTIRHIDATVISGKKRITANGSDIDVTNYASVDVAIANPIGAVSGRLQADGTLRGRLSAQGGLSGGLSIGTTSAFPAYEGPYEVTPTLEMQALGTQGKLMQHNVTINEIPVTRTSNPYDGITVLIG